MIESKKNERILDKNVGSYFITFLGFSELQLPGIIGVKM
jgi:hypothetical protein